MPTPRSAAYVCVSRQPEHQDAGSYQRVGQQRPYGHQVHQVLQVEQKGHDCFGQDREKKEVER